MKKRIDLSFDMGMFMDMNEFLVILAVRYGKEMRLTGLENKDLMAVEEILNRSPKYNSHRSAFRYMYGQLRGFVNGTVFHPAPSFIYFGY